jgi:hypothetical protein
MTRVLTLDKLRTYEVFGGDRDGHVRAGAGARNPSMRDDDWALIDELLTGLDGVATGIASPAFADRLERRLRAVTADDATRAALRELALRLRPRTA